MSAGDDLTIRVPVNFDYDPTGAQRFRSDLERMRADVVTVVGRVEEIVSRVNSLKAADPLAIIPADLDKEAAGAIAAMEKWAQENRLFADSMVGMGKISKTAGDGLKAYSDGVLKLATESMASWNRAFDGKALTHTAQGQAEALAAHWEGMIDGQDKYRRAFVISFASLEKEYRNHVEQMSAQTGRLIEENNKLDQEMAEPVSSKLTLSAMADMAGGFADLVAAMDKAAKSYKHYRDLTERSKLDPGDELYTPPILSDQQLTIIKANAEKARNIITKLMTGDSLERMFGERAEGLRNVLGVTLKQLNHDLREITNDRSYLELNEFLKGAARSLSNYFIGAKEEIVSYHNEFTKLQASANKTDKLSFGDMVERAHKLQASAKTDPEKQLLSVAGLETSLKAFETALDRLIKVRKEAASLTADYGGKSFDELQNDSAFMRRYKELTTHLASAGSLLVQIQNNDALKNLLPEGTLAVVEQMSRELAQLGAALYNPTKQQKGTFLDVLKDTTFLGTAGALRSGIIDIKEALAETGKEGLELADSVDLVGQMIKVGLSQKALTGLYSLSYVIEETTTKTGALAQILPRVKEILGDFSPAMLEELSDPRYAFDRELSSDFTSYAKVFGEASNTIDEFKGDLLDMEKVLDRLIGDGEKYDLFPEDYIARAREMKETVARIREASPKELAAMDLDKSLSDLDAFFTASKESSSLLSKSIATAKTELKETVTVTNKLASSLKDSVDEYGHATKKAKELGIVTEEQRRKAAQTAMEFSKVEQAVQQTGKANLFGDAINRVTEIRKRITDLNAEIKQMTPDQLQADPDFVRRYQELRDEIKGISNLLDKIQEDDALTKFLPENADTVISRLQTSLLGLAPVISSLKADKKGDYFNLGIETYAGGLGALKVGFSLLGQSMAETKKEAREFADNMGLAMKMLEVGNLQEKSKGLWKFYYTLKDSVDVSKQFQGALTKLKESIKGFSADELNEMWNPRTDFDNEADKLAYLDAHEKKYAAARKAASEYSLVVSQLRGVLDETDRINQRQAILPLDRFNQSDVLGDQIKDAGNVRNVEELVKIQNASSKQIRDSLAAWERTEIAPNIQAVKAQATQVQSAMKMSLEEAKKMAVANKEAAAGADLHADAQNRTADVIERMHQKADAAGDEIAQMPSAMNRVANSADNVSGSMKGICDDPCVQEMLEHTKLISSRLEEMVISANKFSGSLDNLESVAVVLRNIDENVAQLLIHLSKASEANELTESLKEAALAADKLDEDNAIMEVGNAAGTAADRVDMLTASQEMLIGVIQRIDDSLGLILKMAEGLERVALRFTEVAQAGERLSTISDNIGNVVTDIKQLEETTEKLSVESKQVAESQEQLGAAINQAGVNAKNAQANMTGLVTDIGRVEAKSVEASDGLQRLDTNVQKVSTNITQIGAATGAAAGGITNLGKAVETTDGYLRTWDKNSDEITDGVNDMAIGMDRLVTIMDKANKFKGLTQRLDEDVRRIKDEREEIVELRQSFEKYLDVLKKTKGISADFESSLRSVGVKVLALNGDFREAHEAMTRYAQAYQRISEQSSAFSIARDAFTKMIPGDAEGKLGRIRSHLAGAAQNAHDMHIKFKLVGAGIEETNNKLFKTVNSLGKLKSQIVEGLFHAIGYQVTDALQNIGYAVKQFIVDSVTTFNEFEQGMAEIYTIMPEASYMMRQQLADDMIAITKEFGYLQNEVLPAAYQALSQGIDPTKVTDAVEITAKAARASVSELEPTLMTGTSLVNAYGGELYDLAEIYDLLFYAIKEGSITMDDINNQMAPIIAVAGEVGVAFEDIVASMIVMSRQGDDMGSISQLLSNMLTQLQIPSSALGKAFEDAAGTGFREFIDEGGNLVQAMELINDWAQTTGVSLVESIGGDSPFYRDREAMLGVIENTGVHLEDLKRFSEGAANAAGMMDEAYKEVDDTLWLASKQSAATTEELKRQTGEALTPLTRAWYELVTVVGGKIVAPLDTSAEIQNLKDLARQAGLTYDELGLLLNNVTYNVPKEVMDENKWGFFLQDMLRLPDGSNLNAIWDTNEKTIADVTRKSEDQLLQARVMYMALASNAGFSPEEIIAVTNEIVAQVQAKQALIDATKEEGQEADKQIEKEKARQIVANQVMEALGFAKELQAWEPPHGDWIDGIRVGPDAAKELDEYGRSLKDIGTDIKTMDGDTLHLTLDGVARKIRLQGIDTAEIEHDGEGKNMAYGMFAKQFADEFIFEANGKVRVELTGEQDKFERDLGSVYNEFGQSLEDEQIKRGFSVPIPIDLAIDEQHWQYQKNLAIRAAQRGIGIFQNELIRALYLEGTVTEMPDISAVYDSVTGHFGNTLDFVKDMEQAESDFNEAQGEWVEGTVDHSKRIAEIEAELAGDLTKERRSELDKQLKDMDEFSGEYDAIAQQIGADLTENKRGDLLTELERLKGQQGQHYAGYNGDPEEIDKATAKIKELEEATQDYFDTLMFNTFMQEQGGITKEVVDLGVALGMFTQEQGDAALKMANIATAIEMLAKSAEFATISVGQQTTAMKLLMDGWVTTAEEALGRVKAVKDEQDLVLQSFQSGAGTQVYWDMGAGETPEFPFLYPADKPVATLEYTIAPASEEVLQNIQTSVATLSEEPHTVTFAADTVTFFDGPYEDTFTKVTDLEESDPLVTFKTEHTVAEKTMDRLNEKAKDKTITYTYDVVVNGNPPDGAAASGGPIYPGTWLVGELGPELITMNGYGYVTNNNDLRKALGANNGSGGPQITVNIDARGIDRHDMYYLERSAKNGIVSALRSAGYTGR